jgi:hypothetical protein
VGLLNDLLRDEIEIESLLLADHGGDEGALSGVIDSSIVLCVELLSHSLIGCDIHEVDLAVEFRREVILHREVGGEFLLEDTHEKQFDHIVSLSRSNSLS